VDDDTAVADGKASAVGMVARAGSSAILDVGRSSPICCCGLLRICPLSLERGLSSIVS